jgi:hypothetical protein
MTNTRRNAEKSIASSGRIRKPLAATGAPG